MLPTYLCLGAVGVMVALAAFSDIRQRRIPNRLTGALAALYPVYVLVAPTPVAWAAALVLALLVTLVGFGLFARALIGGGDVKLLAALSLWAGSEQFVWFMLVTTLAGGALSLLALWYRRWGGVLEAQLGAFGFAATATHGLVSPETPASAAEPAATLPYGVAIAAGGIAIIIELAKL